MALLSIRAFVFVNRKQSSRRRCCYSRYTLLKIIKGAHVMSGIVGLASMLNLMQDMCMLGDSLSNIKSHGWMIFRVKTMHLGVGEHPHPYIRIGW